MTTNLNFTDFIDRVEKSFVQLKRDVAVATYNIYLASVSVDNAESLDALENLKVVTEKLQQATLHNQEIVAYVERLPLMEQEMERLINQKLFPIE